MNDRAAVTGGPVALRNQALANFAASGVSALLQLALTPIYLLLLGPASVGLIGIYTALSAVLQIFDFGTGATVSRELARGSAAAAEGTWEQTVFHTLERVSLVTMVVLGAGLLLASRFIATSWFSPEDAPPGVVYASILLIAIAAPCRFQLTYYQNALIGARRQIEHSAIVIAGALLGAAVVFVLWRLRASVVVYFAWQLGTVVVQIVACRIVLMRALSRPPGPRWDRRILGKVRHFALSMSGITASGILLTQMDKLALSRLLPLEAVGFYVIGSSVASSLTLATRPLFNVVFPAFSGMIAAGHAEDAARSYRQWLRVTSVIVAPPALVIALFAPEILLLWTGSSDAVNAAGLLTTILVLGTAANILMVVPYALQVAQGSMAAMLRLNLALIALQAGVIAWAVPAFGAIGAACGWLAVNVVYILVGVPMVHRSVFGRTLPTSFVGQVGPPIVAAAMVVIPARWLLQRSWAPAHAATLIAGTLGVALLAAFGAARFFPAAAARGEG